VIPSVIAETIRRLHDNWLSQPTTMPVENPKSLFFAPVMYVNYNFKQRFATFDFLFEFFYLRVG
jgi:hypothetical protein